jgi:hypothetical protein
MLVETPEGDRLRTLIEIVGNVYGTDRLSLPTMGFP